MDGLGLELEMAWMDGWIFFFKYSFYSRMRPEVGRETGDFFGGVGEGRGQGRNALSG